MAMVPNSATDDPETPASPAISKALRGKGIRAPMKMKTPGMGEMLGAPRPRGAAAMGKITPSLSPYETPKEMAKGGSVSASKRADGCCVRGKTKGKMV
jgi:hypothetical protein